jgi:DNA sulfur modification protein DndD
MLGELADRVFEAYRPDQTRSLASDPDAAEHYVEYLTAALTTPNTPCCRSVADDRTFVAIRDRLRDALKGTLTADPSRCPHTAPIPLSDNDRDRARSRIQDVLEVPTATLQAMVRRATELERELAAAETSIGEWDRTLSDVGLFDRYQSQLAELNQRLGRVRTERADVEDERSRASTEIGRIDIELSQLLNQCEDGRQHGTYVRALSDLHALLGEYVSLLRKAKASDVARAVTGMYRRLASKGDRVGQVTIDPDTYAVLIEGPSGAAIERRSLSAGEKEVFAVSLLWGLAQSAHVRLPVVIDTPLSRLDSVHRDRIVTDYLPHASHQVIVLSTDTEVDRDYYQRLSPYINHAMRLSLSTHTGNTIVEEGYFWEG